MEVYVLDSLRRRVRIIDKFNSLIWTERMKDVGDFELVVNNTRDMRTLLKPKVFLAMNESHYAMEIKTVTTYTDEEGRRVLKATGFSLEHILDDRIAMATMTDGIAQNKWSIEDTPTEIARYIFHQICVAGQIEPDDDIEGVVEDNTIFPDDTIPEPDGEILFEFDPQTVLSVLKKLADIYSFGFRLVRKGDTGTLEWSVYMGSDRTSGQTELPAIIFSPELGNLENTKAIDSTTLYKNIAYIYNTVDSQIVYGNDTDEATSFERRVMVIKADDVEGEGPPESSSRLIQLALEELAKQRRYAMFDGEISQFGPYKYGQDYFLADLVELRNEDGFATIMQVTEVIHVSDAEGERAYPTLTINRFNTPGSWSDPYYNRFWPDFDETEFWSTQP